MNRGLTARDLPTDYLATDIRRLLADMARQRKIYLQNGPPIPLAGRRIIPVDDGIATGASMRVALAAVAQLDVLGVVIARYPI
ncbi:hypothetical protein RM190_18725 [Paracoccus sp. CPCC 101403]|uniref:Phosphoribosyltransferase domain-containing protein n=2 Tax=Paracoccus broussonetiae TaxID=3075834 RepID=A0ABU3EI25_9RHOB|nr:hypothetical protein [Paracoccus sp. CPCC 101403]